MDISVLFRSLLFTPFLQRPFAADPVVIIDWFGGNRRRSILQHDMCQTKVVTVGWFRIFRADRLQFGSPVFWSRGVRFTWGSVVHITTKSMSKLAYWSRVAQEIMHRAWCLVLIDTNHCIYQQRVRQQRSQSKSIHGVRIEAIVKTTKSSPCWSGDRVFGRGPSRHVSVLVSLSKREALRSWRLRDDAPTGRQVERQSLLGCFHSQTRCKRFARRRRRRPKMLLNMRLFRVRSSRMLTDVIIRADTTNTTVRRATRLRAKVESVGGNCEFSTAKRYGCSHIGVTRD